ncbi:MAG: phage tail tape measure protein [Candidatus Omnitrophota bacterium]|nr:MAG: phage tail tape measure protein [Candidatus Omnitrophota bacterium]
MGNIQLPEIKTTQKITETSKKIISTEETKKAVGAGKDTSAAIFEKMYAASKKLTQQLQKLNRTALSVKKSLQSLNKSLSSRRIKQVGDTSQKAASKLSLTKSDVEKLSKALDVLKERAERSSTANKKVADVADKVKGAVGPEVTKIKQAEKALRGMDKATAGLTREQAALLRATVAQLKAAERYTAQAQLGNTMAGVSAKKALEQAAAGEKLLITDYKIIDAQKRIKDAYGRTVKEQKELSAQVINFSEIAGAGQESRFATIGMVAKNAFRRVAIWGTATAIFYGVVRALRSVVAQSMEVETQITELKKVMSTATTDFEMMGRAAFKMGKDLGTGVTEALKAMVLFGRQGLDMARVIDMARTALLASNVTLMSAEEAASALTAAIRQFRLQYSDAAKVLDVWNKVANNNAVTAQQLATAVSTGGVAAKNAGISFEQYTAITSAMAEATRKVGSQLGRSMRMIFTKMFTPKAASTLKEVGVQMAKNANEYRSAWDILNDLAKVWGDLTNKQKMEIGVAMAGRRRYADVVVTLENWDRVLKALGDTQTSAMSAMIENVKYMKTYEKQISILKTSFQELAVAIGKAGLIDMLKVITKGMEEVVPSASGAIRKAGSAVFSSIAVGLGTIFALAFGVKVTSGMSNLMTKLPPLFKKSVGPLTTVAGYAGVSAAGAFISEFTSSMLDKAPNISSTWKKVLSAIPSIAMITIGAITHQWWLVVMGITDAVVTLGKYIRSLAGAVDKPTTKLLEQLGVVMDQIDALKEINTSIKNINKSDASRIEILKEQHRILMLIAKQAPEKIKMGVEGIGIKGISATDIIDTSVAEKTKEMVNILYSYLNLITENTRKTRVKSRTELDRLLSDLEKAPLEKRGQIKKSIQTLIDEYDITFREALSTTDAIVSVLAQSHAKNLKTIRDITDKEKDDISASIKAYAEAFAMLHYGPPTIKEQALATAEAIKKFTGLTEEQFKKSKISEIIIDFFNRNGFILDSNGKVIRSKLDALTDSVGKALQSQHTEVKGAFSILLQDFEGFAKELEEVLDLPLVPLDKFASDLTNRLDTIEKVMKVAPTSALIKPYKDTVKKIADATKGLSLEALASFPSVRDYFERNEREIKAGKYTFAEIGTLGGKAIQKAFEIGTGLDLSKIDKKLFQMIDKINKMKEPSTILPDFITELNTMDLSRPVNEWAKMTLVTITIHKLLNLVNKDFLEGIKSEEQFKRRIEEAKTSLDGTEESAEEFKSTTGLTVEKMDVLLDLMDKQKSRAGILLELGLEQAKIADRQKSISQSILENLKKMSVVKPTMWQAMAKFGKEAYGTSEKLAEAIGTGFPNAFEKWRKSVLGVKLSQSDLERGTEDLLYALNFLAPSKSVDELIKRYIKLREEINKTKSTQNSYIDFFLKSGQEQARATMAYIEVMSIRSKSAIVGMGSELRDIISKDPFLKSLYTKKVEKYYGITISGDEAQKKLEAFNKEAQQVFVEAIKGLKDVPDALDTVLNSKFLSGFGDLLVEAGLVNKKAEEKAEKERKVREAEKKVQDKISEGIMSAAEEEGKITTRRETAWDKMKKALERFGEMWSSANEKFEASIATMGEWVKEFGIAVGKLVGTAWEKIKKGAAKVGEFAKEHIDEITQASSNVAAAGIGIIRKIWEEVNRYKNDPSNYQDKVRTLLDGIVESTSGILQKIIDIVKMTSPLGPLWDLMFPKADFKKSSLDTSSLNKELSQNIPYDFWDPIQQSLISKIKDFPPLVANEENRQGILLTINIGNIYSEKPEEVKKAVIIGIDESIEKIQDTVNAGLFRGTI